MDIRFSVADANSVRQLIDDRYRFKKVEGCQFFCKGQNDTYRVSADGRTYFFRLYRCGFWRKSEVVAELKVLDMLSRSSVDIGEPVRKVSGSYLNYLRLPEGLRYGVLFREVSGRMVLQPSLKDSQELGVMLGEIHNRLKGVGVKRPELNESEVLEQSVQIVSMYEEEKGVFSSNFRRLADRLGQRLKIVSKSEADWGLCHGDFYLGNIRVDQKRSKYGVFDFDCCMYTWTNYDLACFLLSLFVNIEPHKRVKLRWNAFVRGYRTKIQLSERELELIPLLGVLRIVWILTLHSKNAVTDRGISSMNKQYFDRGAKLLASWNHVFDLGL